MHRLILISVHLLAVINRCVILIRCSEEKMKGRDKMKRRPTDAYLVSVSLANNSLAVIMADLVEVVRKSIWGTERAVAYSPLILFIIFPIMSALCDPFYRSPFFTTCISYIFLFKSLITVRGCRGHTCSTPAQSDLTQEQPLIEPASYQLAHIQIQDLPPVSFYKGYETFELLSWDFKGIVHSKLKFCHHLLTIIWFSFFWGT